MLNAQLHSTLTEHKYRTDTTIPPGFVKPAIFRYPLTSQQFVINNYLHF